MDKILACGCSHTDANFKSLFHPELDTSWPKWPELFAEKINGICNNIGHSGDGNSIIFKKALLESSKINYDMMLILWTECTRLDIYDKHTFYPTLPKLEYNNFFGLHQRIDWIQEGLKRKFFEIRSSAKNLADNMFIMEEYCRKNNIKLIQAMTLDIYEPEVLSGFINYSSKYNFKTVIGLPFAVEFGGYTMRSLIRKNLGEKGIISDLDRHFSAEGQQLIAEVFYEHYKKLY